MSKHKRDHSRRKGVNMRYSAKQIQHFKSKYKKMTLREPTVPHGNDDFYTPFFPDGMKVIIIGSMTSPEGIDLGYYYMSRNNRFWEILDVLLRLPVKKPGSFTFQQDRLFNAMSKITWETPDYLKRDVRKNIERLLSEHNIGICDIFRSCRFEDDGTPDDHKIHDPYNKSKTPMMYYDTIIKYYYDYYYDHNSDLKLIIDGEVPFDVCEYLKIFKVSEVYNPPIVINARVFRVHSPCNRCGRISYSERLLEWGKVFEIAGFPINFKAIKAFISARNKTKKTKTKANNP
jgi:hypothetical protein